jgi:hypothetical protein
MKGPIDKAWDDFVNERPTLIQELPKPLLDLVKYAFYVGALSAYNPMVTSMRDDLTLVKTSQVSNLILRDLNRNFESYVTDQTRVQ